MMTVSDVISKTNCEDVFAEYKKHYGAEHKIKVMDIVQKMKEMNPSQNSDNMILFIRAIKENECGDDVVIDTFDCDDKTIFFDVCGKDDDYDGLYSIASTNYEDLLGYFVSDETLARFNSAQIIAHIVWALDW